jgi:hypothetical protein
MGDNRNISDSPDACTSSVGVVTDGGAVLFGVKPIAVLGLRGENSPEAALVLRLQPPCYSSARTANLVIETCHRTPRWPGSVPSSARFAHPAGTRCLGASVRTAEASWYRGHADQRPNSTASQRLPSACINPKGVVMRKAVLASSLVAIVVSGGLAVALAQDSRPKRPRAFGLRSWLSS